MSFRRELVHYFGVGAAVLALSPTVAGAVGCLTGAQLRVNGVIITNANPLKVLGSPSGLAGNGGNGWVVEVLDAQGVPVQNMEVWVAQDPSLQGGSPGGVNLLPGTVTRNGVQVGINSLDCTDPVIPEAVYLVSDSSPVYYTLGGNGPLSVTVRCSDDYQIIRGFTARSTDIEGDGDTDEADENALRAALGTSQSQFDLNFSATPVDAADLALLVAEARRRVIRDFAASSWQDVDCFDNHLPNPGAGYTMIPPSAITNLQSVCGQLNWTAPADDGSTGRPVSAYEIRYSASPITAANYASASVVTSGLPVPGNPGTVQFFNSSAFAAGTYFAVKAIDVVDNFSGMSNVVQKDCVVPGAIANLAAVADLNAVKLTWTASGDDGAVGQAAGYDLRYSTSPITVANFGAATEGAGGIPGVSGTAQCAIILSLDSCRNYYFAVKTRDDNGNLSAISNVVLKKTRCSGNVTLSCGLASPDVQGPEDETFVSELRASGPTVVNSGVARFDLTIPSEYEGAALRATIFDIRGGIVQELQTGNAHAGTSTLQWNLRNAQGAPVVSGVYYLSAEVAGQRVRARLVVAR